MEDEGRFIGDAREHEKVAVIKGKRFQERIIERVFWPNDPTMAHNPGVAPLPQPVCARTRPVCLVILQRRGDMSENLQANGVMGVRRQELEPSRGGEEINGVIGCELLGELDELCRLEPVLWHVCIFSFPHSANLLDGGTPGRRIRDRRCQMEMLLQCLTYAFSHRVIEGKHVLIRSLLHAPNGQEKRFHIRGRYLWMTNFVMEQVRE